MVFDLGTYRFSVYALPGHSAGSMMLFDHAKGLLIAGDAVVSNKAGLADALWMQMPSMAPIDRYLSALQVFRAKVAGRIKPIYGGHNDWLLLGETYLDNLQAAAQHLVDAVPDSLMPSLRPAGVWMAVRGDRLSNPD
jgi:glyoxylase-like metal-dependent hydrolase (beta-lactamase superfamily II)